MFYSIVPARENDPANLAAVELAAAKMLAGHAPESVLAETTPLSVLCEAQDSGRLWVALCNEQPVGFALAILLPYGQPHLAELSVDPLHGRQGLGTQLVGMVREWARAEGYAQLSLTTFNDLAWNRPFYERLGFDVIAAGGLNVELLKIQEDETSRGLDPNRRVAMRLML